MAWKSRIKVKSKQQVDEIWFTQDKLKFLHALRSEALHEGKYEVAQRVEAKCYRIRQLMLKKYDVIL